MLFRSDGNNIEAREHVAFANTLSGVVMTLSCCTSEQEALQRSCGVSLKLNSDHSDIVYRDNSADDNCQNSSSKLNFHCPLTSVSLLWSIKSQAH